MYKQLCQRAACAQENLVKIFAGNSLSIQNTESFWEKKKHPFTPVHAHIRILHQYSCLTEDEEVVIRSRDASSKLLPKILAGNLTRSQIIHKARDIHLCSSRLSYWSRNTLSGSQGFCILSSRVLEWPEANLSSDCEILQSLVSNVDLYFLRVGHKPTQKREKGS